MRIVHVSVGSVAVTHGFGGAVQRRIRGIAQAQAALGHEVVVYSAGAAGDRVWQEGVEIRSIRCRGRGRIAWLELQRAAVAELKRSRQRVDVIHFHNQPEGAVFSRGLAAATFLSFDYFLFHGGARSPLYPIYRRCLRGFDGLLPVSVYCRAESAAYWKLDPDAMTVVYNGVDVDQFQPDPALGRAERQARVIDDGTIVLLYVGRVCRQKGSDTLLEAYRALRGRGHAVQLVICGPIGQFGRQSDPDPEGWIDRIRAAGALYLGPVAEERLAAVYNLADIFVMPTRTLEMFGMAAVEALACGKPVVASDHGGLRETVPTRCGGRFTPGDPDDLCARIEELLRDPQARQLAAACARDHAETFRWSRITEQLEAVYTQDLVRVP
jgi:glycosyltransferase involved in cell wall biosynthesis